MPFKTIAQPKRVATLEGEIRGAAYHPKLDQVAFISNNPVVFATLGRSGVGLKTYPLTLDDTQDVALISRDMAAVRTGTEVWQVLDLAHRPRVDPLGTDVRALVGDESALGLRWDNTCDQYQAAKNEVSLRNFALRGALRSIDVGENECYAVADIDEGEFRIHPGKTPEQGSVAKVALPTGSKKLSSLRGSKFLSVAYERGTSTLAVVTRAGNRLTPKLLRVDLQLADAVLCEQSLVVVARDGRAVLFDSEAIEKATSTLTPKSETSLGVTGEPTSAVMARGNLFVGTNTGEIVMAVMVRKQVMM